MTRAGRQFKEACDRFLEETDINFEMLAMEELKDLYFRLHHEVRQTIQDRIDNLALTIVQKEQPDEDE